MMLTETIAPKVEPIELEVSAETLPSGTARNLFNYYERLRGNKDIPDWQDFEPAEVVDALPNIMNYEAHSDGSFFVSLVGENCRENVNLSTKRQSLESCMHPKNYADVLTRLQAVRDGLCPHLVRKKKTWMMNGSAKEKSEEYSVLFLPFRYEKEENLLKIVNLMHFHKSEANSGT